MKACKNDISIISLLALCGTYYSFGVYGAGTAAMILKGRDDLPLDSRSFFIPITVFSVLACLCFASAFLYGSQWKNRKNFVLLTSAIIVLELIVDLVRNVNSGLNLWDGIETLIVGSVVAIVVYLSKSHNGKRHADHAERLLTMF